MTRVAVQIKFDSSWDSVENELRKAVKDADEDTIIVVDDISMQRLALAMGKDMGKNVNVEVDKRLVVPLVDWHMALARAVEIADSETTIIVDTEAKRDLAHIAAARMSKKVTVEIEPRS